MWYYVQMPTVIYVYIYNTIKGLSGLVDSSAAIPANTEQQQKI